MRGLVGRVPSLPHVRGGVSVTGHKLGEIAKSSPRPWGCFHAGYLIDQTEIVFPTSVGVFLDDGFSITVEGCLPHVRGGVSAVLTNSGDDIGSSPRPWGCFSGAAQPGAMGDVFPTSVGVFLVKSHLLSSQSGLPHVRGGVSPIPWRPLAPQLSSPRPWGCFRAHPRQERHCLVFPTSVGVFPPTSRSGRSTACLPHVRGGVSEAGDGQSAQR